MPKQVKFDRTRNTAFFRHGSLYDVYPRNKQVSLYEDRAVAYCATQIVSDGIVYDLLNEADVDRIPVPLFTASKGGIGITGTLDYLLRMCAANLRQNPNRDIAYKVYKKAMELMRHSGTFWSEADYLRMVEWYYEDGRFEEGDEMEAYIRSNSKKDQFANILEHFELVEFLSHSGACCETCAIYSGRVYSVSGRHPLFPKLPDVFKRYGCAHLGCDIDILPYMGRGYVEFKGVEVPIETAMQRPYRDDRTASDIATYKENKETLGKSDERLQKIKEYHKLRYLLPDLAPKSLSAYSRMRNANTAKFLNLKQAALAKGIVIASAPPRPEHAIIADTPTPISALVVATAPVVDTVPVQVVNPVPVEVSAPTGSTQPKYGIWIVLAVLLPSVFAWVVGTVNARPQQKTGIGIYTAVIGALLFYVLPMLATSPDSMVGNIVTGTILFIPLFGAPAIYALYKGINGKRK
ncbi:MAG: hypothetical protein IJA35_07200 [Clostridia bacterium]|nr:hypothetical protein [Clostridia bacterium]